MKPKVTTTITSESIGSWAQPRDVIVMNFRNYDVVAVESRAVITVRPWPWWKYWTVPIVRLARFVLWPLLKIFVKAWAVGCAVLFGVCMAIIIIGAIMLCAMYYLDFNFPL